jgi:alkylation response protein AidB-like acyl-CoA dehydrogenase
VDFTLTSEQEALVDSVRRFREREYGFERRRPIVESARGRSPDHWRTFAELGWLGVGLPEEVGGYGGGPIENALIFEEFGRGLIVEPLIAHVIAAQLLARHSPGERADRLAAMIAGEERIVLAHLEPEGRDDRRHVGARAEWQGDRIRLSGHKSLVLGGPDADRLLVSARDAGGISLFLVDSDAAGLRRQAYRTLDNHRVADIWLENVAVGMAALVGRRGEAYEAIDASIDYGIVALCAEAVGAMDAVLWMTRDYLKVRQQFGTTLNNFQALQHRMADMLIETELSRSILYQGLSALETLDSEARRYAISATKTQVAQAGLFVGGQAIQLHGAIGVTEEHAVGHYYKRLFVIAHLFGGADHHRERCRESLLGGTSVAAGSQL